MGILKRTLVRADADEEIVRQLDEWLKQPPMSGDEFAPMRGKLEHLARLAREALDRHKLDESGGGGDLPPLSKDGGGGSGSSGTCRGCRWCVLQETDQDVGYLCTIDPPVIWKGENRWRFLRPEVDPRTTPACSRRDWG